MRREIIYNIPVILRVADIASILHLHEQTVRRYIRTKKLSASKIGRQYYMTWDNLLEFIAKHAGDGNGK